jgi:hypothetical protein
VAPQALSLFNGDFVNQQARHLAKRLVTEVGDNPDKQIERAYLLALCRPPSKKEQEEMMRFLQQENDTLIGEGSAKNEQARKAALEQMCRVILNLNEFVYAD